MSVISGESQYVTDIAKVDATGQVFRYPFDKENQKHLTDLVLINVLVLKSRFNILEKRLKELNRLSENLIEEYALGSFTVNLSRVQLLELATALPRRDRWADQSFDTVKKALQEKYILSNREFCKALNIIQRRPEIAGFIDVTVDIPGLSLQAVETFIDLWSQIHDIEKVKVPPRFDLDVLASTDFPEGFEDWHSNRMRCRDALAESLTPEVFSVLRALFYFYRDAPYSEVFDRLLAIHGKDAVQHLADLNSYKRAALHLLDKTNALEGILNSLNFLGQSEILSALLARYGLNECRHCLLELSEGQKERLQLLAGGHASGGAKGASTPEKLS